MFNSNKCKDETFKPELKGKNILRYGIDWNNEYVSYGEWIAEPRNPSFFQGGKILVRQIPSKKSLIVGYTEDFYIIDQSAFIAKSKNSISIDAKYVLVCLNSKLMFWYFRNENNEFDELFPKIKAKELKSLPILEIHKSKQLPFIEKANIMLEKNEELQKVQTSFLKLLQSKFENLELSKKLSNWHSLTFGAFIKELEKQKIKLSLQQQTEWMSFFDAEKEKALAILATIHATDKAIDAMVYALYNLTEEEIKIVEGV